ncbi:hypothetical protein PPS11_45632 [Pseudomonas putida S11]|nr:hypothetical protein PPS11_45632 [Pseudomonas putida S11]
MSEVAVNKTKKRFIAGAVCPACSETDKLMMWNEDGVPHRECVACGFTDTLNEQGLSVPKELGTRGQPSGTESRAGQGTDGAVLPQPEAEEAG